MNIQDAIDNKQIFQSNTSGPFIIIKNLGCVNKRNKLLIQFINTGYITECIDFNAFDGKVRDKSINSISTDYDISRFINYENHIDNLLRVIYAHMISRCYNTNDSKYCMYGELGIKVCDEWLNNINKFISDARLIDRFDKFYYKPFYYNLDKDYKQMHLPKNKRIYSKDTCIFISKQDNSNLKIIDHKNERKYKYFGVEINAAGNYYSRIRINGNRINLGTFSNEIAAANAYNYWSLYFHNYELVPLLNDVPYMPPDEFIKYNVAPKIMCNQIR